VAVTKFCRSYRTVWQLLPPMLWTLKHARLVAACSGAVFPAVALQRARRSRAELPPLGRGIRGIRRRCSAACAPSRIASCPGRQLADTLCRRRSRTCARARAVAHLCAAQFTRQRGRSGLRVQESVSLHVLGTSRRGISWSGCRWLRVCRADKFSSMRRHGWNDGRKSSASRLPLLLPVPAPARLCLRSRPQARTLPGASPSPAAAFRACCCTAAPMVCSAPLALAAACGETPRPGAQGSLCPPAMCIRAAFGITGPDACFTVVTVGRHSDVDST
jgi:hypothetical protein